MAFFDAKPILDTINQIANPVVKSTAMSALDLARTTGNAELAVGLQTLLGLPATPAPLPEAGEETRLAVLASGRTPDGQNNLDKAGDYLRTVGPQGAYGWGDTAAGMFAANTGRTLSQAANDDGEARYALENVASALFADQARTA